MTLVAVVLVFLLLQYGRGTQLLQRDAWLYQWQDWLSGRLHASCNDQTITLITLLLPSALVALLCLLIGSSLYGLPLLLALIAILVFSLGRGDFAGKISDYLISWRAGDFQSAYRIASTFSHGQLLQASNDPASLHRHTVQAMVYQGFERWFAVIFWFVLAGPFGAVFYRLSFLLANRDGVPDQHCQNTVCRIIYYLEWLPVRLFAVSAAIVGNFVTSIKEWQLSWRSTESTEQTLMNYSLAALGEPLALATAAQDELATSEVINQGAAQIEHLRSLVERTVIFSVVVSALLVLL